MADLSRAARTGVPIDASGRLGTVLSAPANPSPASYYRQPTTGKHSMNIRYTPKQKLLLTRQIHALTEEGQSMNKIAKLLRITRDTISSYLALPCPTEEEIAAAPDELPPGKDTQGGLKQVRAYLSPGDLERLKATSGDPQPNMSDLARQAIQFWIAALTAINANDPKPVKLCGVKVRFERKAP